MPHEQGVIHRDVKPENILLTRAGLPKLGDFGLAWVLQQEAGDEGGSGEGTQAYVAPELANDSETPGPRTDLYSLGVTFYQMLTGLPPRPVREHKVPSTVLPILRKMIHANPNLRFASAQECLSECLEMERSLELAARTEEETQERVRRTLDKAFSLLGELKLVDARAALERVLAEDADDTRAATGTLLVYLLSGDMPESSARYSALLAADCVDPTFLQLRTFFEGLERPTVLEITPRPVPFSYSASALRQGRLVKDLGRLRPRQFEPGRRRRVARGAGPESPRGRRYRLRCRQRRRPSPSFSTGGYRRGVRLSLSPAAQTAAAACQTTRHSLAPQYRRRPVRHISPGPLPNPSAGANVQARPRRLDRPRAGGAFRL